MDDFVDERTGTIEQEAGHKKGHRAGGVVKDREPVRPATRRQDARSETTTTAVVAAR